MNEIARPAQDARDLALVARREVATRMRGTAFRVSTIVLLAATVAGNAMLAALTGHPQRFTVAVTAQAPPMVTAMVRADGQAAGLQITAVTAADRSAAIRQVEQAKVTAAVAAGGETIWKARPDSTLQPVLNAAVQQAIITERAANLGLSPSAAARLLAPVQITTTQLHRDIQRTGRIIIAEVGMILLYLAITFYGSFVLTGVVEEKSSRVVEVLLSRVSPSSLLLKPVPVMTRTDHLLPLGAVRACGLGPMTLGHPGWPDAPHHGSVVRVREARNAHRGNRRPCATGNKLAGLYVPGRGRGPCPRRGAARAFAGLTPARQRAGSRQRADAGLSSRAGGAVSPRRRRSIAAAAASMSPANRLSSRSGGTLDDSRVPA